MKEVIKVLENTFCESTLDNLKEYINANSIRRKWIMYSDYCIGDRNKVNDAATFTIMPYDDYPDKIKNKICQLSHTDIKNKKKINPDFIKYLKEKRLFHISFILGSRDGLIQANGLSKKDALISSIEQTKKMLNQWCENTPDNAEYFEKIKKKLKKAKNKLSKNSPSCNLFRDVALISLLAGYIGYFFTKFGKAEIFGWYSDRDKIVEAYDGLVADLFNIHHHYFCKENSIKTSATKITFGIPNSDENGKVWYDDMNHLPDHIAGTLADWDFTNNLVTKNKFISILQDVIADNPYCVILRLNLKPNMFQCSRIFVSKKPCSLINL